MSFKEDLIKARGHLIIITAVIIALAVILRLEKFSQNEKLVMSVKTMPVPEVSEKTSLNQDEIKMAQIAWKYFDNNYNSSTGMVNSVDSYTASTMWDTGSYIFALHSAYKLGIIKPDQFYTRLGKLLKYLEKMPLFDNQLPNKSYSTKTSNMVNYRNQVSPQGIGWSAIDLGRLVLALNTIKLNYSVYDKEIIKIFTRFNFKNMVKKGKLFGAYLDDVGKIKYVQEGRLGYEEYAAKALATLNLNTSQAEKYDDFLQFIDIYDIKVPADTRDFKSLKAHNYVLSEPYIMELMELGGDAYARDFAFRVFKAQEERFNKTGILTAVTEDNINKAPYFVYNTVFTDGQTWACITDKGEDASNFKTISSKAVFGWHNIFPNEYTNKMMAKIKDNYNPNKGWFSGIYEVDGKINKAITCNTNAIILESLYYKSNGRLYGLGL